MLRQIPRGFRTYGPRDVEDQFYMLKKKDEILAVRAKIEGIYSSLPPDIDIDNKSLLEMGFCFGLLNPLNNIIVNTVMMGGTSRAGGEGREPSRPAGGEGTEPSRPAEEGGKEQAPPRARGVKRRREPLTPAEEMAQRSLDGLTAFLTCLFPYLPDAEAWKYLDAAGADPLVASTLIIRRRNIYFKYNSQTKTAVEVALRCAAVAAKHPDPQSFVTMWRLVSISHLAAEAFVPFTSATLKSCDLTIGASEAISSLEKTALEDLTIRAPESITSTEDTILLSDVSWPSAKLRFEMWFVPASSNVLPSTRAHMKRMLLAKIHGFYMEALGRLPKVKLRSCYHRSMLIGGYCYGPFDPVSNIILNTIWYEKKFPPSKQFEVSMISTHLLWRIVARSLYGLISFMCTRFQSITPDAAIEYLLVTNAYLPAAFDHLSTVSPTLLPPLPPTSTSVADAYVAAGTAAFHCSPSAHSEFLASDIGEAFQSFPVHYKDGHPLSSEDMSHVVIFEHPQQDIGPTKVTKRVYVDTCRSSASFWDQHDRVTGMVRHALDKFNETAMDDERFELHIIFGVNEFVSGPVRSTNGKVGNYNPWTNDKFYHSHINFLAVCKKRPLDAPILFFAECGKDGSDTCWCVPVIPQKPEFGKPRCVYCEHEANRIVHPTVVGFHGRNEFAELFYLSDREFYNNDEVIEYNGRYVDWVYNVSDAAIYLNSYPDEDDDGGDEADWIDIY